MRHTNKKHRQKRLTGWPILLGIVMILSFFLGEAIAVLTLDKEIPESAIQQEGTSYLETTAASETLILFETEPKQNSLNSAYAWDYEENNTGITLKAPRFTPGEKIVIPSEIDGKTVTQLGESFLYSSTVTDVEIPDTVTNIGPYAFKGSKWLEQQNDDFVICGDGVLLKYNGQDENVTIPSTVKYISDAFEGCKEITSISIPDSVERIGDHAFYNCTNLVSVFIPNSVISIGTMAFGRCFSLVDVCIPNSVTEIGEYAFYNCESLINISLPDKLTSILDFTFDSCSSLTSVSIPDSVERIGLAAFARCSSLVDLDIPESVLSIDSAFSGTPWIDNQNEEFVIRGDGILLKYNGSDSEVIIPSTVKQISDAFYGSTIVQVSIPESVSVIGSGAFSSCENLFSVTIPASVKEVGQSAFSHCTNLSEVIISEGVYCIGNDVFSNCISLYSICLPSSLTSMGSRAFYNCVNLEAITIPSSISEIACETFYGCENLKKVVISEGVTTIGASAFQWCHSLSDVNIPSSVTTIEYAAFGATPWLDSSQEDFVICGDGILLAYNGRETKVTIPSGVKRIEAAFHGSDVVSVHIPEGVVEIGYRAFLSCTKLSEVSLPSSVAIIGQEAFGNNESLTSVTIPEGVISIGVDAFNACENLSSITISQSVKVVGDGAFANCNKLASAVIPAEMATEPLISIYRFPSKCVISTY